jgi:putative endonuclease
LFIPMLNRYHNYYIYITTNPQKKVLYAGVTNDLARRLAQHWRNRGSEETFAGKYYCYNLIYYEHFLDIRQAIAREKEIKRWRREKKIELIRTMNPAWSFLNDTVCEGWPPV